MITLQVPTLDAAQGWLLALGFAPADAIHWRNTAGDTAAIVPVFDRWGGIRAYRVEIHPAPKLPSTSRASHYS